MPTEFVPTVAPKMKLRWYQYSLRSLMLLMLLSCLAMSWVATKIKQGQQQKAAVEEIEKLGGQVTYDYEQDSAGATSEPPGPAWLRKLLGDDTFRNVTMVDFNFNAASQQPAVGDAGLENLKALTKLRSLNLCLTKVSDAGLVNVAGLTRLQQLNLSCTKISDAGLVNVAGLTRLQELNLSCTKISDAGLQHLRRIEPAPRPES